MKENIKQKLVFQFQSMQRNMVVNSESTAGKTGKKKRSSGEKSKRTSTTGAVMTCDYPLVDHEDRRHRREKYTLINDGEQHHYDRPRRSRHQKRAIAVEDDHLYDVVRPRGDEDANTYQNVVVAEPAVYQNMDDL